MKLLFDQNLSPKLVDLLSDIYPKSIHVYQLGLDKPYRWRERPARVHFI